MTVTKNHPEIKENYKEYCPNGNSYLHAAHTAYFIQKYVPDGLFDKAELYQAAHHHVSGPGELYREADCLSSGMERYGDEPDPENYKDVRLHSVFDMVELQFVIRDKEGHLNSRWMHRLVEHSGENLKDEYPEFVEKRSLADDGFTYRRLWEGFSREIEEIKGCKNLDFYLTELYWLLEKYTSCIPSATNAFPDISLFDHAKTTAAIASCLHLMKGDVDKTKPEFVLYGGDISGIQEYIFKISQSQGVGGIAKRLRGRSFRIAMLSEILSRYLLGQMGLSQANVNFCGGGNFELLLPNSKCANEILDNFEKELNNRLLEDFHGELGFVGARVTLTKQELREDFALKKDHLWDALNIAKLKKYQTNIDEEGFWREERIAEGKITICKSCNLNLVPADDQTCESCHKDKGVGEKLTKAAFLFFRIPGKTDAKGIDRFGTFELAKTLIFGKAEDGHYSLSDYHEKIKAHFGLSKTLPFATKELSLDTEKDEDGDGILKEGQLLSFATIADMAKGDKKIGVLKMDVDNLGLVFSMGLEAEGKSETQRKLRSISRLSTLSRQLSVFCTGHLDAVSKQVFTKWRDDPNNDWPHKESISNIFYLIFAGGDDLVVVGPWDQIIELARVVRKAFKDFTCHNPNLTISAGIYICKPKYPISHAVYKAEEALKQSKNKGRNRITVMGETSVWAHEDPRSRVFQDGLQARYHTSFIRNEITGESVHLVGVEKVVQIEDVLTFEELMKFSRDIQQHLERKSISRGFIRSLLEAQKKFYSKKYNSDKNIEEEQRNMMVLPNLLYAIERNVEKKARDELRQLFVTEGNANRFIRQAYYPCRYLFMKNR